MSKQEKRKRQAVYNPKRVVCYECGKAPGTLVSTPKGPHCQGSCSAQGVIATQRQLAFLDTIGSLSDAERDLFRKLIESGAFAKRARKMIDDEEAQLDRDLA